MNARRVERCGLCDSDRLDLVFSLGSSPPTCVMQSVNGGRMAAELHTPLELLVCRDCTLVQLSQIVDPETVFPPDYPYSSGNSPALHRNFEELAEQASEWVGLGLDDLVVDIGANDGTLLSKFEGCRTVGVEPTGQGKTISEAWVPSFFDEDEAATIRRNFGPAKVITACNVLAHVEDIGDVMRGIEHLLADDGILIAENHDLKSVVDGQWDTVYHEHLRYFDPFSFDRLLGTVGMAVVASEEIPTHGGSFRTIAAKGKPKYALQPPRRYDFTGLVQNAAAARWDIREALLPRRAGGVYGIGATARATTIINYCGLDVEDIDCVCEVAGSDKIGKYIPGTRIPVVDEARLFEDHPPTVLLFSWHLANSIVPKLRQKGFRGMFVVPLPTVQHL